MAACSPDRRMKPFHLVAAAGGVVVTKCSLSLPERWSFIGVQLFRDTQPLDAECSMGVQNEGPLTRSRVRSSRPCSLPACACVNGSLCCCVLLCADLLCFVMLCASVCRCVPHHHCQESAYVEYLQRQGVPVKEEDPVTDVADVVPMVRLPQSGIRRDEREEGEGL